MPASSLKRWIVAVGLALAAALPLAARRGGAVLRAAPSPPEKSETFLFYLHGAIIEEQGPRPTHPRFGVYEYEKILLAFATEDLTVVSEQRPPGTDVHAYAEKVAAQVRALLAAGVPRSRVYVVGFSKGGAIALRASSLLADPDLRFVLLAGCFDGDRAAADLHPKGRFLSLIDAADDIARPCAEVLPKRGDGFTLSESKLKTGRGHGTFYRPEGDWPMRVVNWLKSGRQVI